MVRKQRVVDGILESPATLKLCMGISCGAPNDLNTFLAMVNNSPQDWHWSVFSIGQNQMPFVVAALLAGGDIRVGLKDNLWLDGGVLAINEDLVLRVKTNIEAMGARVMLPESVRAGRHVFY